MAHGSSLSYTTPEIIAFMNGIRHAVAFRARVCHSIALKSYSSNDIHHDSWTIPLFAPRLDSVWQNVYLARRIMFEIALESENENMWIKKGRTTCQSMAVNNSQIDWLQLDHHRYLVQLRFMRRGCTHKWHQISSSLRTEWKRRSI